jgi:hypothetical protein
MLTFLRQGDGITPSPVIRLGGYFEKMDVPRPIKVTKLAKIAAMIKKFNLGE